MNTLSQVVAGSTKAIEVSFYDESDEALTPTSVTWSLFSEDNSIINSRHDVSITTGSSITIVLSGADLAYFPSMSRIYLVVNAVYNSTYGNNLPLIDYFEIPVLRAPGE